MCNVIRTHTEGLENMVTPNSVSVVMLVVCAVMIRPSQVSADVILLRSLNSSEYDFLENFKRLNITVILLPVEGLGFQGIWDKLVKEFGKKDKIAVVGTGDRYVDAIAGFVADSLSLPFIGLERLPQETAKYSVGLDPSFTDRAVAITAVALELGCSGIVSVSCGEVAAMDQRAALEVRRKASEKHINYQTASLRLRGSPLEVFSNITNVFLRLKALRSSLVLLDCSSKEVCLLEAAARQLELHRSDTIFWLITRQSALATVSCLPISTERLGLRLGVSTEHMVYDALSLLNRSISDDAHCTQKKELCGSNETEAKQRGEAAETLTRSILQQDFLGLSGQIKFSEDGVRYGAKYHMVKVKELPNGSHLWKTVGSVIGSKATLLRDFWSEEKRHSLGNTIRAVLIEEEPLLIEDDVKEDDQGECLLTHKCTKYVKVSENSSAPDAFKPKKSCCRGFLINVLHSLERDLNVHVDAYLARDGKFGAIDPHTRQWNGMVKDLIDGEYDMALTSLTISESRSEVIDFSNPFLYGQTRILISTRDTDRVYGLSFRFLDPFDSHLWMVTLLHIFVIWITAWCLEKLSPCGHYRTTNERKKPSFSLTVCMSYVWSNFCKLQLEDATPRSFSARFTTAVFSFAALILTTSYTANLAASLVSSEETNLVTGIRDPKFQNPPKDFKFATLQSSNTETMFTSSEDPAFRKIGENMKPHGVKSYSDGLEKLRNGHLNAFIYDSPFLDYGASKLPGCVFRVVGKPIKTISYGFGFPKRSPWKEPISKLILKYKRKDYFGELTHKWFTGNCLESKQPGNTMVADSMDMFNVSGLLLICGCTAFVCGVLLGLEIIWYHKVSSRRRDSYFI